MMEEVRENLKEKYNENTLINKLFIHYFCFFQQKNIFKPTTSVQRCFNSKIFSFQNIVIQKILQFKIKKIS